MSNKNLARRAAVEISFGGIDITKSIQPYLLSLTYTDNEEDETDDLQIKLQDREGLWMCKWLNDVVNASASTTSVTSTKNTGKSTGSSSTTSTSSGKDIVDIAISQIGYKESGDNRTKYGAYTGTNGLAWCHAFVSWCANQAGISTGIVPKTASTTDGMNWFKKRNLFQYKGSYTPKRGDIVYFKTGASHVGIVEYTSGSTVHTIEGNSSNAVRRRSYALSYKTITGYGTPKYTHIGGTTSSVPSNTTVKNEIPKLKIQAVIVRENWIGDGKDGILNCGQFELDSIDASGPPSTITIKGTSLPYTSQIRQTKKSKAWEAYTLSGIAQEMARTNGMTCMYLSANDPYYSRVEQYRTSDINFLSTLCHNAGISLKVTNNIIVLFDQAAYESKNAVRTIMRGSKGGYIKYKLTVGEADTQYTSCRVSYVTSSGKKISAIAYIDDYDSDSKKNQQLEISAKVSSIAEAKKLAEKQLRLHNKYARGATFTMPGDPGLVAGVTVMLADWGAWSGKYIISQAKHTAGDSGYTVQVKMRRVLGETY